MAVVATLLFCGYTFCIARVENISGDEESYLIFMPCG